MDTNSGPEKAGKASWRRGRPLGSLKNELGLAVKQEGKALQEEGGVCTKALAVGNW